MMFESGRVVAVEPDGLWVETIRQSTCGACAARKGCGHSVINSISDGQRSLVRVLPGDHVLSDCTVDDRVRFSIPEEVILRGSLVVYILPLACMLLGAVLAAHYLQGSQDLLAATGAAVGFGMGFALVRWHAWLHREDVRMQPTLVEILHPPVHSVPVA
jgi:sigma-E factor negative regulatory protein RseC